MTMASKPKLKASRRLIEYPDDGFVVLDGNLYCNYCDCHVSWTHKSDVLKHTQTGKHCKTKKQAPSGDDNTADAAGSAAHTAASAGSSNRSTRQCSLGEMMSASAKKSQLITDLITIFAVADIPLQKVDAIRPFLRKHVINGGSIPGSTQLRETYLPRLMPEMESAVSSAMKDITSLNIILDETTDNTDRVVLDILFKIPHRDKPVLAQTCTLTTNINHQSLAQCVMEALGKHNISLTKGIVDTVTGDGASYITKAYKDILQPLIPDLLRVWCLSHQLSLVGEKWRDHKNNGVMKKYLSLMNSVFSHSTARKIRFKAVCQRFGLPTTLLPKYNATRWNSWYRCVVANHEKRSAIATFIYEECEACCPQIPQNLIDLKEMLDDQSNWFTVSLTLAFTATCMKRLSILLDLFQSRRPLSHLVKGHMDGLVAYYNKLSTSVDPTDFGIQRVLQSVEGLSEESIALSIQLCQQVCSSVAESVQHYINSQPSLKFFEAARVFDPRIMCGSPDVTHDIAQYKAIPWLMKDMDNSALLEEWAVYIGQRQGDLQAYSNMQSQSGAMENQEHFDISRYWNDRRAALPRLADHALRALDVPVSSADAEGAFSNYNKLVCFSRMSLSDESVKVLHATAWNGDISGRFKGYTDV